MEKINVSEISPGQLKKIQKDLRFIDLATKTAKDLKLRAVISGGYAVDGALGKITRFHNDIDIQIYGNRKDGKVVLEELLKEIEKSDQKFSNFEVIDKGRKEFYQCFFVQGKGLGVEVYYIEVVGDPFANEKIVVKRDGSLTPQHKFGTIKVTLNQVDFEAQNPVVELADRVYKREIRGDEKKSCHQQDIINLKKITNPSKVAEKIVEFGKR